MRYVFEDSLNMNKLNWKTNQNVNSKGLGAHER